MCAAPCRILVVWITLSGAAGSIFSSGVGKGVYQIFQVVAHEVPLGLPLPVDPGDLPEIWWASSILLAFTWFQPLLLRLDSNRTTAWIAVFTVLPIIGAMIQYQNVAGFMALFPYVVGITAALTSSLLLIGQRTRPWLGLFAGVAFMLGLLAASEYVSELRGRPEPWAGLTIRNADLFDYALYPMTLVSALRPSLSVIMFGNVLFGLPLIFGTTPTKTKIV